MTNVAVPTRAITIRPPWSTVVAAGVKTIENRGRTTHHRGPIAIHAGTIWCPKGHTDPRIRYALAGQLAGHTMDLKVRHHAGHIVAVANLIDCHPVDPDQPCCQPWGDASYKDGPCYHLVLNDVQRIEPIPAVGALTVGWLLQPATIEALTEQLQAVPHG